jgi:hypothetical protein
MLIASDSVPRAVRREVVSVRNPICKECLIIHQKGYEKKITKKFFRQCVLDFCSLLSACDNCVAHFSVQFSSDFYCLTHGAHKKNANVVLQRFAVDWKMAYAHYLPVLAS